MDISEPNPAFLFVPAYLSDTWELYDDSRALTTVHVRLDGVERIVRIASELLDVNMDPVTNPLNATVMPDGLDLSVKDVSLKKDSFIKSTPKY